MAAMMETDEDAELALLGSEEDDEQTLRRFLDALPRDTKKRRRRRDVSADLPAGQGCCARRCGRSTGRAAPRRAVPSPPQKAARNSSARALHIQGRHGAPAVRKRRRHGRSPGQGRHHFNSAPPRHRMSARRPSTTTRASPARERARAVARRASSTRRSRRSTRPAGGAREFELVGRATRLRRGRGLRRRGVGPAAHRVDVSHRVRRAAEDPLRLAALELLQGFSTARSADLPTYLAQLIDVAEQDDGQLRPAGTRAASRVLAAADTDYSRARPGRRAGF